MPICTLFHYTANANVFNGIYDMSGNDYRNST